MAVPLVMDVDDRNDDGSLPCCDDDDDTNVGPNPLALASVPNLCIANVATTTTMQIRHRSDQVDM
jgi:hypothetical protein